MLQHWLVREPSLSFGLPVFVFAAVVFPLHLGWTGASIPAFGGYLLLAAILFAAGDAHRHWRFYDGWAMVGSQAILTFFALAVPAVLAFSIGSLVGPVDEALDESVCASRGTTEVDTPTAEADDAFDVTPDCA